MLVLFLRKMEPDMFGFWQRHLARVAIEGQTKEKRKLALEKLKEQSLLAYIAKTHKDCPIRLLAEKKITDPIYVADVAKNGNFDDVRFIIAAKITDQRLAQEVYQALAITAFDKKYGGIWTQTEKPIDIVEAISKITDEQMAQQLYAKFALDRERTNSKRLRAARELSDIELAQPIFADIAKSGAVDEDRLKAATLLADKDLAQVIFADLGEHAANSGLRFQAIELLTDENLAQRLYLRNVKTASSLEDFGASKSFAKIVDQRTLAKLALYGKMDFYRLNSVVQLTDETIVNDEVKTYLDTQRISRDDTKILIAIAKKYPDVIRQGWGQIVMGVQSFHVDTERQYSDCSPTHDDLTSNNSDLLKEFPANARGSV
jgi:hypothetical protein